MSFKPMNKRSDYEYSAVLHLQVRRVSALGGLLLYSTQSSYRENACYARRTVLPAAPCGMRVPELCQNQSPSCTRNWLLAQGGNAMNGGTGHEQWDRTGLVPALSQGSINESVSGGSTGDRGLDPALRYLRACAWNTWLAVPGDVVDSYRAGLLGDTTSPHVVSVSRHNSSPRRLGRLGPLRMKLSDPLPLYQCRCTARDSGGNTGKARAPPDLLMRAPARLQPRSACRGGLSFPSRSPGPVQVAALLLQWRAGGQRLYILPRRLAPLKSPSSTPQHNGLPRRCAQLGLSHRMGLSFFHLPDATTAPVIEVRRARGLLLVMIAKAAPLAVATVPVEDGRGASYIPCAFQFDLIFLLCGVCEYTAGDSYK
ncbi:hypothetical protein R3P38DRAFT_3574465 [Favolaschia claudopus]|uniref:Uncharacterized protein n=1 Tax=Favolaschia claudopus TaxID=2862362 RepID=A0AAW0AN85_9AGAR